jgi:hypothetical protein
MPRNECQHFTFVVVRLTFLAKEMFATSIPALTGVWTGIFRCGVGEITRRLLFFPQLQFSKVGESHPDQGLFC